MMGGVPAGGKQRIVCLLSQLSELEIVCLWDPPSVQLMENWSGLLAQLCYKLLENSSITKDQLLRDRVVHLLGVLVRDYGQALSELVTQRRCVMLSYRCVCVIVDRRSLEGDSATPTFRSPRVSPGKCCGHICYEIQLQECCHGSRQVSTHTHTHRHTLIPSSLLWCCTCRELGSKDPRDLAIDSSGTRSFASFLVELCHLVPDCVLLSVSVLLPHLNGESYTFRNGVLGVMAEILLHLHKSPLDDQSRQLRDSLFTRLEDHIHDTNAFVRVKVLQLLLQLITCQVCRVIIVGTSSCY